MLNLNMPTTTFYFSRCLFLVSLDELMMGLLRNRVSCLVSRGVLPSNVLTLFAHGLGCRLDDIFLQKDSRSGKFVETIVGLLHDV